MQIPEHDDRWATGPTRSPGNGSSAGARSVPALPGPADGPLEEALRQAQANLLRYQHLFDFAPDGYLVTDLLAVIQEANHAAADMLGSTKEFLRDRPLFFYLDPQSRQPFVAELTRLSPLEDRNWAMVLAPLGRAPVAVDVNARITPTTPPTIRWMLRDVSESRRTHETLRAEKEFSEALIEMADVVALVLDPEDRIVRVSRYLSAVSGWSRPEFEGQPLTAFVRFERDLPQSPSKGSPVRDQELCTLLCKDGRTRTLMVSRRPLPAGVDARATAIVAGTDVSELHLAQQSVRSERLAVIGQTVTTLAHEGRNVLQRAQGCLTRLGWRLEGRTDELDLVERSRQALDDLQHLFDDIRNYAAPMQLDVHSLDLAALWRDAWTETLRQHPERDASLDEDLSDGAARCPGDRFRMWQVFTNLFANALEACPDPVRVRIACCTTTGNRAMLEIRVEDNGPGFSAEQRRHALEPFFTTKAKGTGLGLAIVRRNLEAHGGSIDIAPGRPGARITLTLPCEP